MKILKFIQESSQKEKKSANQRIVNWRYQKRQLQSLKVSNCQLKM
jgi:hypothetical protein